MWGPGHIPRVSPGIITGPISLQQFSLFLHRSRLISTLANTLCNIAHTNTSIQARLVRWVCPAVSCRPSAPAIKAIVRIAVKEIVIPRGTPTTPLPPSRTVPQFLPANPDFVQEYEEPFNFLYASLAMLVVLVLILVLVPGPNASKKKSHHPGPTSSAHHLASLKKAVIIAPPAKPTTVSTELEARILVYADFVSVVDKFGYEHGLSHDELEDLCESYQNGSLHFSPSPEKPNTDPNDGPFRVDDGEIDESESGSSGSVYSMFSGASGPPPLSCPSTGMETPTPAEQHLRAYYWNARPSRPHPFRPSPSSPSSLFEAQRWVDTYWPLQSLDQNQPFPLTPTGKLLPGSRFRSIAPTSSPTGQVQNTLPLSPPSPHDSPATLIQTQDESTSGSPAREVLNTIWSSPARKVSLPIAEESVSPSRPDFLSDVTLLSPAARFLKDFWPSSPRRPPPVSLDTPIERLVAPFHLDETSSASILANSAPTSEPMGTFPTGPSSISENSQPAYAIALGQSWSGPSRRSEHVPRSSVSEPPLVSPSLAFALGPSLPTATTVYSDPLAAINAPHRPSRYVRFHSPSPRRHSSTTPPTYLSTPPNLTQAIQAIVSDDRRPPSLMTPVSDTRIIPWRPHYNIFAAPAFTPRLDANRPPRPSKDLVFHPRLREHPARGGFESPQTPDSVKGMVLDGLEFIKSKSRSRSATWSPPVSLFNRARTISEGHENEPYSPSPSPSFDIGTIALLECYHSSLLRDVVLDLPASPPAAGLSPVESVPEMAGGEDTTLVHFLSDLSGWSSSPLVMEQRPWRTDADADDGPPPDVGIEDPDKLPHDPPSFGFEPQSDSESGVSLCFGEDRFSRSSAPSPEIFSSDLITFESTVRAPPGDTGVISSNTSNTDTNDTSNNTIIPSTPLQDENLSAHIYPSRQIGIGGTVVEGLDEPCVGLTWVAQTLYSIPLPDARLGPSPQSGRKFGPRGVSNDEDSRQPGRSFTVEKSESLGGSDEEPPGVTNSGEEVPLTRVSRMSPAPSILDSAVAFPGAITGETCPPFVSEPAELLLQAAAIHTSPSVSKMTVSISETVLRPDAFPFDAQVVSYVQGQLKADTCEYPFSTSMKVSPSMRAAMNVAVSPAVPEGPGDLDSKKGAGGHEMEAPEFDRSTKPSTQEGRRAAEAGPSRAADQESSQKGRRRRRPSANHRNRPSYQRKKEAERLLRLQEEA